MPSIQPTSSELGRHGLEGPVEVVGDGQQLAQQRLAGQTQLALAILRGPAPEVGEVGGGPLQAGEMLGRLRLGRLELGPKPLELGAGVARQARRRRAPAAGCPRPVAGGAAVVRSRSRWVDQA